MTGCLLLLALVQQPGGLGTAVDEGVLIVRQDTLEVARESFRLTLGRLSRGETGWILATTIRYDRARPVIVLAPILEVNGDTMPVTLQYDVADPRQPSRVLGQLGRGRFTVRYVTRETERAREFPIGTHAVVLDDSVFALYLIPGWLATTQSTVLTAILPRSLRRETVQVQDQGVTATTLNRNPAQLRQILVTREDGHTVHLWLDTAGRLMKVEIPSERLIAERLAGG
ncbi:MAG TPA: hypothetical protein VKD28_04905 [Gemmatimonadales bacterium]|nr:hypothetical protein [Gemmatimonadales bacterium]